jgi:hypothetical protein
MKFSGLRYCTIGCILMGDCSNTLFISLLFYELDIAVLLITQDHNTPMKKPLDKAATDTDLNQKGEDLSVSRKQYVPPRLTVFGKIGELTQAGTTGGSEGGGSMGGDPTYMSSDITLKTNINRVGTHPLGFGLYLFEYKDAFRDELGTGRRFGVMAQEVEKVVPAAVQTNAAGHKMVNYSLLGISLPRH